MHAPICDNESAAPRWWNTEGPLTRSSDYGREGLAMKATQECSVPDCESPARRRGWCHRHYTRWWRHGDPMADFSQKSSPCSVEGCEKVSAARGWCQSHYARWLDHGDPTGGRAMLGQSSHPLYSIWRTMHQRCGNPNNNRYLDYGGRGVTVCDRWTGMGGFLNFLADMGERPPNPAGWTSRMSYWSLDRIDNDGDYEPSNCRWATPSEQQANRRIGTHPEGACDR